MSETAPEAGDAQAEQLLADAIEATAAEAGGQQKAKAEVDWKAKSREWERRAKSNADAAKRLAEIEESQKTAEQKLTERTAAAEAEAQSARTKLLRYEVAGDKNLPAALAARLQGSTKEELEADADVLLAELEQHRRAASPSFDSGARTTPAAPADMNALIRQKAGLG